MTKTYSFDKSRGNAKSLPLLIAAGGMALVGAFLLDFSLLGKSVVAAVGIVLMIYGSVRQRGVSRFVERIVLRDGALTYYLFIDTARALTLPPGTVLQEEPTRITFVYDGKPIAVANRNQLYGKRGWDELLAELRSVARD